MVLIYYQSYIARLSPLQDEELLLALSAHARRKILSKTRRLRRGLTHQLDRARPPSLHLALTPGYGKEAASRQLPL